MKKIILIAGLITILSYGYYISKDEIIIPKEAIRFRIIPNSNHVEDLKIKEEVKNEINDTLKVGKTTTVSDARNQIKENIPTLEKQINNLFTKKNYNKNFKILYGENYFPEKKYNGIKYKEGMYESLVIKIGEAKGNNFWCVLYPPLCMIDEEQTKDKKEYKFFIKEIISKYL